MTARVTLCRDCCCGTSRKHPGVDHALQERTLRDGLGAALVVSGCLLACERSNVVVVSPTPAARNGGARPVWLSGVLSPAATSALLSWALAGGPGVAPLPAVLEPYVDDPGALSHLVEV